MNICEAQLKAQKEFQAIDVQMSQIHDAVKHAVAVDEVLTMQTIFGVQAFPVDVCREALTKPGADWGAHLTDFARDAYIQKSTGITDCLTGVCK